MTRPFLSIEEDAARSWVAEPSAGLAEAFVAEARRDRIRGRITSVALNVLGVALFLLVWEFAPRVMPDINQRLLPPPSTIFAIAWPMVLSGEIPHNILVSLRRSVSGFAIAVVGGVLVGVLTARARTFRDLSDPLLHALRSLPVIALVPLSILWFGIGEGAKIALITAGAFFPIWINTFIGVRDVPQAYLRSAACLGASRWNTLLYVILPAALPLILAGMRQAIAVSLIVLVAAELAGATAGVAYMMSMGYQLFRVDIMFAGLILLGALGFAADRLFNLACRWLFPWYRTLR